MSSWRSDRGGERARPPVELNLWVIIEWLGGAEG